MDIIFSSIKSKVRIFYTKESELKEHCVNDFYMTTTVEGWFFLFGGKTVGERDF